MKIGVMSDLHGSVTAFDKVMKMFNSKNVELILNAGDVFNAGPRNVVPEGYAPGDLVKKINELTMPMIITRGNCDSEVDQIVLSVPLQSPYAFLYIERKKIIVNHGHKLSEEEKVQLAARFGTDIFVVGHTHLPKLERFENMVMLNPGSPSLPKGNPTVATIELNGAETQIEIFNVDTGNVVMR